MRILEAVETVRGVECEVEVRHETDDLGPYTAVVITVAESGEPLFETDPYIEGHATIAEARRHLVALAQGRPDPTLRWAA